jgi:hypothetical protein
MALTYELDMGAKCAEIKAPAENQTVKRIPIPRVVTIRPTSISEQESTGGNALDIPPLKAHAARLIQAARTHCTLHRVNSRGVGKS